MSSLLSLAREGGRRPDEGGFLKNNAKNLTTLKKAINTLKIENLQLEEIDFVLFCFVLFCFVLFRKNLNHRELWPTTKTNKI
jgi:hypothetical protein